MAQCVLRSDCKCLDMLSAVDCSKGLKSLVSKERVLQENRIFEETGHLTLGQAVDYVVS